uniref:Transposase n=1 Tax=Anaerobacillus isosaccharinicus TaxID=1532552 RepID=A0A7S7RC24_9BACI|nr:transposase [Anaerobacillus isosaccharinicus]
MKTLRSPSSTNLNYYFELLFLQTLYDLSDERMIKKEAQVNLAYKWFIELTLKIFYLTRLSLVITATRIYHLAMFSLNAKDFTM